MYGNASGINQKKKKASNRNRLTNYFNRVVRENLRKQHYVNKE